MLPDWQPAAPQSLHVLGLVCSMMIDSVMMAKVAAFRYLRFRYLRFAISGLIDLRKSFLFELLFNLFFVF